MLNKTLLVELATEDLPSKNLKKIAISFYDNIIQELKYHNILYKEIEWFATPRRLAIKINTLNMTRLTKEVKKIGPSLNSSFDNNGKLKKPAISWLNRLSINISQTQRLKNKSGEWLIYNIKSKTENIEYLLPKIISCAIKNIILPKSMRWDETNIKFSRPIRNILTLLDNKIIAIKFFNIPSSRFITGHFYMNNIKIKITHANEYPSILLKKGRIICNYLDRKKKIHQEIQLSAKKIGGIVQHNETLLEEITSLIEWPTIFIGSFKKRFLILPKSAIICTLENVQRCFPIYTKLGKLMPSFAFVANINPKNSINIVQGHERVINSRLSDAEFFYTIDRKKKLKDYLIDLKKIIFYKELGSIYDKTKRLKLFIQWLAKKLKINVKKSVRAATLSKCDLVTNMVSEFPDIQGSIGMTYALNDGEDKEIAVAIKEHYYPSFSEDTLPSYPISYALAIVDKVDTIVGMFVVGKEPKKDKDPFSLRRLAIGVLRILIEEKISINLLELIEKSSSLYNAINIAKTIINKVNTFFLNRISAIYLKKGFDPNIIQSITSLKLNLPIINLHKRIVTLSHLKKSNNLNLLVSTNKRIVNILKKFKIIENITTDTSLILSKSEKNLYEDIKNLNLYIKLNSNLNKYDFVLQKLTLLCNSVNYFFKKTIVKDNNLKIQYNRLSLLFNINEIFQKVANFSYINIS